MTAQQHAAGWRRRWPLYAAVPAFCGVQVGIAFSESQLGRVSFWGAASTLPWVHIGIWLAFSLGILLMVAWSSRVLGVGEAAPLFLAAVALSPEMLVWSAYYLPASSNEYVEIFSPGIRAATVLELPGRFPYRAFFNTDFGRWTVGLSNPPVSTLYFYATWHWLMNVLGWLTGGACIVALGRAISALRRRRASLS